MIAFRYVYQKNHQSKGGAKRHLQSSEIVIFDSQSLQNGDLMQDVVQNLHGLTGRPAKLGLVGGDFQGSNPLVLNARQTVVKEGATIIGDATENGNGGRVFVWSREATAFYGTASVQGGSGGGDGGIVALLGDDHFDFRGCAHRLGAGHK